MGRAMKDSGIEWIGEIPENWKIERLQWCLQEINERNDPIKTTQILSLTNKLGVLPYEDKGNQGNKAKEDLSEYKLAFENTLIVNSMNVIIGSVGISHYMGCVSPVYYVFR
ncbi:MAG: restriction endonuclease subunit S, partial [Oscillospiraceae bacterium]|nr:restriction endonuclease subunit S [Oscillospiraceae bacterium]